MADRVPITLGDIGNVLRDTEGMTSDEWMEKNGVPFEIIQVLVAGAAEVFMAKTNNGDCTTREFKQAFAETVANSFTVGWNCGEQFGGRDNS